LLGALTQLPDLVHGALSYGIMGVGLALVLWGLRIFCGQTLALRWMMAIAAITTLVPAYFVLVYPSLNARLVSTGLIFGVLNLLCAISLVRGLQDSVRRVMGVATLGFVALGLALLVRGVYLLLHPISSSDARAADSVMNGTLFVIPLAQVTIVAGMMIMVSHRYAEKLRRLSMMDNLTGAYNRAGLERMGTRILLRARQARRRVAVLMIDADFFKAINDAHGHPIGDEVLRHLAGQLCAQLRPSDLVVRYGGEEFLLVLEGMGWEAASQLGERIRSAIEKSALVVQDKRIPYTISIGVSTTEGGDTDLHSLIAKADAALYQAKQQGRNCVRVS
jgi:diguanylate cyclase (GGDEF)-like protein